MYVHIANRFCACAIASREKKLRSRAWEQGYMYIITVVIGWVLLASATIGFSGYIKLAYCSSAKGAPVAQLVRASD